MDLLVSTCTPAVHVSPLVDCLRLDPLTIVRVSQVESVPMKVRYVDKNNGLYSCKLVYQDGLCKFVTLDSRRSSELRNPWVCNFSRTWTISNNDCHANEWGLSRTKMMCGRQGSPYMWAHGSWLPWCPTTSHVPVKPEVSTGNGDRLPEVDPKSFQSLKRPKHGPTHVNSSLFSPPVVNILQLGMVVLLSTLCAI